ncbi:MAG: FRG domain-containing protein [Spirochaetales bacterium]|nr:FRG domain-containing protein [Spirochaetales bacterium]
MKKRYFCNNLKWSRQKKDFISRKLNVVEESLNSIYTQIDIFQEHVKNELAGASAHIGHISELQELNKNNSIKNPIVVSSLSELISAVLKIKTDHLLVFRGEEKDYKDSALCPSVYRDYLSSEDKIYRESQRFNDEFFTGDKTAFDRLSRIQHYSAPTRLIDVSQDLLSAVFFAFDKKKDNEDAIIYIFEINEKKVKYYDSDAVSVLSNLAKISLKNEENDKSKEKIAKAANSYYEKIRLFNQDPSVKFLLHEIRDEKPQFDSIIDPKHIFSVQFVLPKLTSDRVKSQKGAFLLFGLNPEDFKKPIEIIENYELANFDKKVQHPFVSIRTIRLRGSSIPKMRKELELLGINKPFIYPEIDKVSEFLKVKCKRIDI